WLTTGSWCARSTGIAPTVSPTACACAGMTRPLGAVARLGLIVPTTNTVNEPEWAACLPPGVSMHVARMPLHTDAQSAGGKEALRRDITVAAQSLADADVDVIAYGCTAGSTILPLSTVPDMIREAAG